MMEQKNNDDEQNDESKMYEMAWKDVKNFHHRYIMNFPKNLRKVTQIYSEMPYPIFNPHTITDFDTHKKLFKPNLKKDSRLEYYRKLYQKNKKDISLKNIKKNEFNLLPQYVLDVAMGIFEDNSDKPWFYLGGILDYFTLNDNGYIARVNGNSAILITHLDETGRTITLPLNNTRPVYNLKCTPFNEDVIMSIRQKTQIFLYLLYLSDNILRIELIWQLHTPDIYYFIFSSLNEFTPNTIGVIDNNHKFKSIYFTKNKVVQEYNFKPEFNILSDPLSQIDYLDNNTVIYMNRKCIHVLDLRSQLVKITNFENWLECDDLCTFSKNNKQNSLAIASVHNAINFDLVAFDCESKVSHMMSTPPFISSMYSHLNTHYVCLLGSQINDKILFYNSLNFLNTPQYVYNIKDSLREARLTKMCNISEYSESRLTLPTLGLKLCKDTTSDDIIIYSSNVIGDVFKQKLVQNEPTSSCSSNKLVQWTNNLVHEQKTLEVTSICNLTNVMHAACCRFPAEKNIKSIMNEENKSLKLFEKDLGELTKRLQGHVAESMNSIWDETSPIVAENEEDTYTSSKHKVSQWLDSVTY